MMYLSFLNLSNDFKHHVHLDLPVLQNLLETSLGNVFFFSVCTHWFRKRKHPWCRLSWKHFWGYHLTHPWLKVWGWLLLWHPPHSTMKHCHSPSRGPTACTTQERAWPGPGIWGGSVLIGKARSVAVDNVLPWHLFACSTNKGLDDGCKPAQILKINSSLCSHHHQEFWQVAKCHFTANAEPSKRGQLHVLVAKSQLPG